jgi:hypothetical protein
MWPDLARSAAAEAVIAEEAEEEAEEEEGSAVAEAEGAIEVGLEVVAR